MKKLYFCAFSWLFVSFSYSAPNNSSDSSNSPEQIIEKVVDALVGLDKHVQELSKNVQTLDSHMAIWLIQSSNYSEIVSQLTSNIGSLGNAVQQIQSQSSGYGPIANNFFTLAESRTSPQSIASSAAIVAGVGGLIFGITAYSGYLLARAIKQKISPDNSLKGSFGTSSQSLLGTINLDK